MDEEKYRIPPKSKINLKDFDPNETSLFDGGKKKPRLLWSSSIKS